MSEIKEDLSSSSPSPQQLSLQPIPLTSELSESNEMNKDSIKNQKQIDWEDFNYPPCLRLFHYNIDEIEDKQEKRTIRLIYFSFLLSLLSIAINFTNAIALTIGGDDKGRIIFYSVLHFLIFSPTGLYVFYHGYKSVAQDKNSIPNYLWQQLFCGICYFIFSIVKGGAFNGFIKAAYLIQHHYKFQAILSLLESISYLLNSLYSLYLIYIVKSLYKLQGFNNNNNNNNNNKNDIDLEIKI